MQMKYKLGKKVVKHDSRTLQLAKYIRGVPVPPVDESYVLKIPYWPMMMNNNLGDCVIAAMGHMIQQWTYFATNGTGMMVLRDAEILKGYQDLSGYQLGDPTTDNGVFMLDALNYWKRTGLGGHKIRAYVQVDPSNIQEVQQAIWLFGNVFAGFELPASAKEPIEPGKWTVPTEGIGGSGTPGTWGGHCVPIMGSSPYIHRFITWGEVMKMTSNFRLAYCDEMYAVLSDDWIGANGLAVNNFDLTTLQMDLNSLGELN